MPPEAILSFVAVFLIFLLVSSVRFVRKDRRIVVLRNGQPVRVAGPGLAFVLTRFEDSVPVDVSPFMLDLPREWLGATAQAIDPPRVQLKMRVLDPSAFVHSAIARAALAQLEEREFSIYSDIWDALESAFVPEMDPHSPLGDEELTRRLEKARPSADRELQRLGVQLISVEVGESLESGAAGERDPGGKHFE